MNEDEKIKAMLVNYHLYGNDPKRKRLNERKLQIVEVKPCDSLIYNLKTVIKKENVKEFQFAVNENPLKYLKSDQNRDYPREIHSFLLPNPEFITCESCEGAKTFYCFKCDRIKEECPDCYDLNSDFCDTCQEADKPSCRNCNDKFIRTCGICKGFGKLKVQKRKTLIEDCIFDVWVKCDDKSIPLKCLLNNKSKLLLNETKYRLNPISTFPDEEVFNVSNEFLKRHENKLKEMPNFQLLQQTQQLIVIPIKCCKALYGKKSFKFYVFNENTIVYLSEKKRTCSIL